MRCSYRTCNSDQLQGIHLASQMSLCLNRLKKENRSVILGNVSKLYLFALTYEGWLGNFLKVHFSPRQSSSAERPFLSKSYCCPISLLRCLDNITCTFGNMKSLLLSLIAPPPQKTTGVTYVFFISPNTKQNLFCSGHSSQKL